MRLAIVGILGDRLREELGRALEHLAALERPEQHLAAQQEEIMRLAAPAGYAAMVDRA